MRREVHGNDVSALRELRISVCHSVQDDCQAKVGYAGQGQPHRSHASQKAGRPERGELTRAPDCRQQLRITARAERSLGSVRS